MAGRRRKLSAAAAAAARKPQGEAAEKRPPKRRREYSEPKVTPSIRPYARVLTAAQTALVCGAWMYCAYRLFGKDDMLSMVFLGVVFFVCLMSALWLRATLEAKRRYGKSDAKASFYYIQQVRYDQKHWLWICLSLFAVLTVGRWLVPSPNLDMTCIDLAASAYAGYVWTGAYGGERVPFLYMETAFLLVVVLSNYVVYFFPL